MGKLYNKRSLSYVIHAILQKDTNKQYGVVPTRSYLCFCVHGRCWKTEQEQRFEKILFPPQPTEKKKNCPCEKLQWQFTSFGWVDFSPRFPLTRVREFSRGELTSAPASASAAAPPPPLYLALGVMCEDGRYMSCQARGQSTWPTPSTGPTVVAPTVRVTVG